MSSETILDAETQKQLTDAEEVANLISSKGWGVIYGRLQEEILDLQNINNLDNNQPLEPQILGRKLASDLIFAWLKRDVFGLVEQAEASKQALQQADSNGYVEHH